MPCSATSPELVFIDPRTGAEQAVKSIRANPLFVASQGNLIIAIRRDDDWNTYLQTTTLDAHE